MPGAGTIPQFRWPVVMAAGNKTIRYGDASGNTDAALAEGTYFWRGDGSAADLAVALDTALTAAAATTGSGIGFTVALADTGILTITGTGAFSLSLGHANTTVDPDIFGFLAATYTSAGNVITSPHQVGNAWFPEQSYIDDTEDVPHYRQVITGVINGRVRTQRWGSVTKRSVLVDVLPPRKVFQAEEVRRGEAFERFQAHLSTGGRYEFCRDFTSTRGTYSTYTPDPEMPAELGPWPATIPHSMIRRYDVRLSMQRYVA